MAALLARRSPACGMSSLTSGIGGGWFGGGEKAKTEVGSVSEDQLLAAAKTDAGTTGSIGGDGGARLPALPGVVARRLRDDLRAGQGRRRAGRHAPRRDHQDGARMPDRARPRHRQVRLLRAACCWGRRAGPAA